MLETLMRENIRSLSPYKCARDEAEGKGEVFLDANENYRGFTSFVNINRYPDPKNEELRKLVENVLSLPFENTVIGNGSDEIIDLLFRIFCEPKIDKVLLFPPTYGAYKVFAAINDVEVIYLPLDDNFNLKLKEIKNIIKEQRPKLTFICSPNNPTGNLMNFEDIEEIIKMNPGITVVDEAYYEFSKGRSCAPLIREYPRLVVLRTLSKCWALAGARIGIGVMNEELRDKMIDVKYPYNVPTPSSRLAIEALMKKDQAIKEIDTILSERDRMEKALLLLDGVVKIYKSDANFILCKINDADNVYKYLQGENIIVRNRSREYNCDSCLRITIGSRGENDRLLRALEEYVWE